MNEGRMYKRTTVGSAAGVSHPGQPSEVEVVWVENISHHGARIVSPRHWKSGDRLVIRSQGSLTWSAAARVVYCQPLPDGHFAIGCKFNEGIGIQFLPQKKP
jgi:hypothetical protein